MYCLKSSLESVTLCVRIFQKFFNFSSYICSGHHHCELHSEHQGHQMPHRRSQCFMILTQSPGTLSGPERCHTYLQRTSDLSQHPTEVGRTRLDWMRCSSSPAMLLNGNCKLSCSFLHSRSSRYR